MSTQAVPRRSKSVEPSPEDRARLSRLQEEIAGRQAEMSLIIARVLGWDPKSVLTGFSLPAGFPLSAIENKEFRSLLSPKRMQARAEDGGSDGGIEMPLIQGIFDAAGNLVGIYDYGDGVCYALDHSE